MYELYHYPNSGNSYKARLALALCRPNAEFKITYLDILKGESRTPEYLKLNPVGQIPLLIAEGEDPLPESHAILWRLGQGTSYLPTDVAAQAQILRWMCFEQYKLEPNLGVARYWLLSRGLTQRECPVNITELKERTQAALQILDAHLTHREYMVGESPSIADIAIFGYAPLAPDIGIQLDRYPALMAWIHRIEAMPNFVPLADEVANYGNHTKAQEDANV